MSILHVRQIQSRLEKLFAGRIDLSDLDRHPTTKQDAFLSRALSAYSLSLLAPVDPATAAAHVTDGFEDNGIDAIYWDESDHQLVIVQAKWSQKGTGAPGVAEVLKVCSGFRDLLAGNIYNFNERLRSHASAIRTALDDEKTRITIVLSYTGQQSVPPAALRHLEELLQEVNDVSELVTLKILTQRELHASLTGSTDGAPISIEAMLTDWGQVRSPYAAFYGQIAASDIAKWHKDYGNRLFALNLRNLVVNSTINQQLAETLRQRPLDFWYFNNGITVLCQKFHKKPIGGSDRSGGIFILHGASVVNGAQTVGAISAVADFAPDKVAQAKVSIRCISLENCPPDFAISVTRATNTQNRIDSRDFAALDPEQERLRRELALDGIRYSYKTGEERDPDPSGGCTIDEATIALACSRPDVGLSVIAKSQVGKLWEDIKRPPYKLLFNSSLTALRLWRSVLVLREVDASLQSIPGVLDGDLSGVAIHGNRFVAHVVFQRLDTTHFDDPELNMDSVRALARQITGEVLRQVTVALRERFPGAYLQMLFKNSSRVRLLAEELNLDPRQKRLPLDI